MLVYSKYGANEEKVVCYCIEKYNDGLLELCSTNMDDMSILNGEGNFVQYIYANGKIKSKIVCEGWKCSFAPMSENDESAIFFENGRIICCYSVEKNRICKEVPLHNEESFFSKIVVSEKIGIPHNKKSECLCSENFCVFFDDKNCRASIQELKYVQRLKDNKSVDAENFKYFDIDAKQLKETMALFDCCEDAYWQIDVHGSLLLNCCEDCYNIFSQNLNKENWHVFLNLSDCHIENCQYLSFCNCISLCILYLPKNIQYLSSNVFFFFLNLFRINIPESVQKVSFNSFDECSLINFSVCPYVSLKNLLYNSRLLEHVLEYEIDENESFWFEKRALNVQECLRNEEWRFVYFNRVLVNGAVLTKYGVDFQREIGLTSLELKHLLEYDYCLVGNRVLPLNSLDSCSDKSIALTGADAILELMRKKNIDKKYANVLIRCFPYIPTRWRIRMNDCADGEISKYLEFSYSNMFFDRLPDRRLYDISVCDVVSIQVKN